MTCLSKCASVAKEKDTFCSDYRTTLNIEGDDEKKSVFHFSFPSKPSTNLINGIIMCAGLIALIIALLLWSSLNAYFWRQRDLMISQGLNQIESTGSLSNTVSLISLCAGGVIISIFAVIFTSFFQFSQTVRTAWGKNEFITRLANGCFVGGVVGLSLSVKNTVYDSYPPFSLYPDTGGMTIEIVFIAVICIGILLIAISYLKSPNLATKV